MKEINLQRVIEDAQRATYDRMRAEHMGWKFGVPSVVTTLPDNGFFEFRISFTCVCGRKELFRHVAQDPRAFLGIDVARLLREHGSFSAPHLRGDGYTEQQIAEIERKGDEFDRIVQEHWETDLLRNWGGDLRRKRAMG